MGVGVEGALGSRQPSVRNGNLPWWIIREGSWSSLSCYIVPLREGALGSQQPSVRNVIFPGGLLGKVVGAASGAI